MKRSIGILLTAVLVGILPGGASLAGDGATGPGNYFSIHVASFKNLANANGFVNSLKGRGKVVFWKKVPVGDKGDYYRIFTGRYATYADAEKVWRQLKFEGQVSYKGIFSFKDLLPTRQLETQKKTQALATQVKSSFKEKRPAQSGPGRFADNRDGTVTDHLSGFMWIQNGWRGDFLSAVTWDEAIDKCRRFKAAGYADWTLPTRAQWESLLDNRFQAPAIVEPNPFKNVIIHMPYWAKDGPLRLFSHRYTTLLYSGNINHQQKNDRAFIWPIREIK